MQMPDDYQIPDDPDSGRMDAAYLRTCLGIPTPLVGEPPEFSLPIRQAHFFMAHSKSRQNQMGPTGLNATELATIVTIVHMLGLVVPAAEVTSVRTFMDDLQDGHITHGDKVVVRYRSKDHAGHFMRVEDGKVIVLHDGNERKFQPTSVRLPKADEFLGVAGSINEFAEA